MGEATLSSFSYIRVSCVHEWFIPLSPASLRWKKVQEDRPPSILFISVPQDQRTEVEYHCAGHCSQLVKKKKHTTVLPR